MATPNQGGGFNLGNAHGSVTISADQAFSVLNRLERSVSGFANRINRIGATVSGFGRGLSTAMLPFAGAMATGINAAGNFQDSLTEIQARTGLTNEAMEEVRQTALQLGADTMFSSQQAADAFLQLLTAGLDSQQALAALPAILDGAAASGADLGTSADLVTNVMSAFNLTAEETQRIVDAMAQGAASSPADMLEMGEALQAAGGIAGEFNLTLEDTTGMMAIFARRGIRGSEAATQLRSIMTNMTSPTENTAKAWDMLGTSLFDAEGNMRNFDTVLADIRTGMEGLTEEQRAFVTQNLAGAYGRIGFNALLASDGIDAMKETMEGQASATEIAEARMSTFMGRVTSLKGSIETLLITTFTPFIEALTPLVERGIEIVNMMNEWIGANQDIVQPMLRAISLFIVMGPVLFGVGQAISLVGFLIGALVNPLQLVMIAGSVFAAAWAADFGNIREIAANTVNFVREALSILVNRDFQGFGAFAEDSPITSFLINLRDTVTNTVGRVITTLRPLTRELRIFFTNMFNSEASTHIFQVIRTLWQLTNPIGQVSLLLRALGVDIWPTLMRGFEMGVGFVTRFFQGLNMGVGVINSLKFAAGNAQWMDTLIAGFMMVSNFITGLVLPALSQLRNWFLNTALPGIISFVTGTAVPAIQAFIGRLQALWQQAQPHLQAVSGWFMNVGGQIAGIITGRIIPILQTMLQTLMGMWQIAAPHLQALAAWFLTTAVPAIADFITTVFLPAINNILGALQRLWTDVSPFLLQLFDWFMNTALPPVIAFLRGTVWPTIQDFIGLLQDLWRLVQPQLALLYDWFMTSGLPVLMDFIEGPVTIAWNGFISLLSGIWDAVRIGVLALRNNLERIFGWIMDHVIQPIIDKVQTFMNLLNDVNNAASSARNDVQNMQNAIAEGGVGGAVSQGASNIGSFFRTVGSAIGGSFATGTNFVPQDMLAFLHKGEAVIPRQFNPAAGGSTTNNNGATLNIERGAFVINANSYEEGYEGMRGASDAFDDRFANAMKAAP